MTLLGAEELQEVVEDAIPRLDGGDKVKEDYEAYGMDYDSIAGECLRQFRGNKDAAALWLSGFHAAVCLASKYWEYRVPPEAE